MGTITQRDTGYNRILDIGKKDQGKENHQNDEKENIVWEFSGKKL
jgi:hypothetical protein